MKTSKGKTWYTQDLDNYTSEFLQEIIVDLCEKKYNASIDRMCSYCGDYATEIDWTLRRYKLCKKCFKKYNED